MFSTALFIFLSEIAARPCRLSWKTLTFCNEMDVFLCGQPNCALVARFATGHMYNFAHVEQRKKKDSLRLPNQMKVSESETRLLFFFFAVHLVDLFRQVHSSCFFVARSLFYHWCKRFAIREHNKVSGVKPDTPLFSLCLLFVRY